MMKMLEAGGVTLLTDNIRKADEDNPKGYSEYERAKKLKDGDTEWLHEAHGKAVKVISYLLTYLPPSYHYRIIFMQRRLEEILASQKAMLIRRGEDPNKTNDGEMTRIFRNHLEQISTWMEEQPHVQRIDVSYNAIIDASAPIIEQINTFLDNRLETDGISQVIAPQLYRQRR